MAVLGQQERLSLFVGTDSGHHEQQENTGRTSEQLSKPKSGKKSVPDVPRFRKCEKNLWSFAGQ